MLTVALQSTERSVPQELMVVLTVPLAVTAAMAVTVLPEPTELTVQDLARMMAILVVMVTLVPQVRQVRTARLAHPVLLVKPAAPVVQAMMAKSATMVHPA